MTDYALKNFKMPLSQFRGVHTELADLPRSLRFATAKNYEDYLT